MAPIVLLAGFSDSYANLSGGHLPMLITEPGHYPTNSATVLTGHQPSMFKAFTYKRHALYLRPPPYTTWCRDYRSQGLRSQTYCVQKCSLAMSLKNGTGVPKTFAYTEVDDNPWYDYGSATDTDFRETLDGSCVDACRQLDCRLVYYSSRDVTVFDFQGITAIGFQLPDEADLVVHYTPRMMFTEYLALMGSILGLWLGFSVYSITSVFDQLIVWCAAGSRRM